MSRYPRWRVQFDCGHRFVWRIARPSGVWWCFTCNRFRTLTRVRLWPL